MLYWREISLFLRENNMSATRFGRLANNDPNFATRVMRGSEVRPETEAKVRKFMENYRGSTSTNR